jgi:hypothetical protein
MTIILDADPTSRVLGSTDPTPFTHEIQPGLAYYQASVPKSPWGSGSWSYADFLQVVTAPWNPAEKAWRLTIFPATNFNC